jgi:hypothetical protein
LAACSSARKIPFFSAAVMAFLDATVTCFQMEVELHPFKNDLRIKQKQPSAESALLTTLQTIPRLGETKARALVERFPSALFFCIPTCISGS